MRVREFLIWHLCAYARRIPIQRQFHVFQSLLFWRIFAFPQRFFFLSSFRSDFFPILLLFLCLSFSLSYFCIHSLHITIVAYMGRVRARISSHSVCVFFFLHSIELFFIFSTLSRFTLRFRISFRCSSLSSSTPHCTILYLPVACEHVLLVHIKFKHIQMHTKRNRCVRNIKSDKCRRRNIACNRAKEKYSIESKWSEDTDWYDWTRCRWVCVCMQSFFIRVVHVDESVRFECMSARAHTFDSNEWMNFFVDERSE